jgi:hypothetical protein
LGLSCYALPVPAAAMMVPAAWVLDRLPLMDPPITSAQLGLLRRGVVESTSTSGSISM